VLHGENSENDRVAAAIWFTSTHWSIILAAGEGEAEARNRFCETYRRPLLNYVHRRGYSPHDAEDLTQEFLARVHLSNYLRGADPAKGKFRSLLLAAMNHFLAKEWRHLNAKKRAGAHDHISLSAGQDTSGWQFPADNLTPEQFFDQQWAIALLDRAAKLLHKQYVAKGKGDFFEAAKIFLTGERRSELYPVLAAKFGMKQKAFEMAVSRLREEWREKCRQEVANTVPPEEVDEEMRALVQALCR